MFSQPQWPEGLPAITHIPTLINLQPSRLEGTGTESLSGPYVNPAHFRSKASTAYAIGCLSSIGVTPAATDSGSAELVKAASTFSGAATSSTAAVIEAGSFPARPGAYALASLSSRREVLLAELGTGAIATLGCPSHGGGGGQGSAHQGSSEHAQCLPPGQGAAGQPHSQIVQGGVIRSCCRR